jgi:hypothetical protein
MPMHAMTTVHRRHSRWAKTQNEVRDYFVKFK